MVYRYSTVIKVCGLDVVQWSVCRTMIYRYSVVVYAIQWSHTGTVQWSHTAIYINAVSIGRNYIFVLHAKELHEVHT